MKLSEASKKLEFHSKQICHGCVHPSMVGWCESHCQLPEAFEMAISALEKQEQDRWIPCDEKLLKNAYGKEFLLTIIPNTDYPDYTKVVIGELGCWNNDVGDAFSCIKPTMINGIIYNIYQPMPLNQVIAWRPLPEAYQEEEA